MLDLTEVKDRLTGATREAFLDATAEHARPPGLSMSGLGGCTRAAAYAVAEVEPSDIPPLEEAREANLGTWVDDALVPRLAKQLPGARVHGRVRLRAAGLELGGEMDLDTDDEVIDLKTVGEHRLHGVRREGRPYPDHGVQGRGYAMARAQEGRPVRWVVWLYLDRASGDMEPIAERFSNAAVNEVIARAAAIRSWALQPDQAPRRTHGGAWLRGPGLSFACDRCWWLKRCWGPTAEPGVRGAQTRLRRRDDLGTQRLLELFDAASAARGEANRDYDFAKAALTGAPAGLYGPDGEWSLRRAADGRPLVKLTRALAPKLRKGLAPVDDED